MKKFFIKIIGTAVIAVVFSGIGAVTVSASQPVESSGIPNTIYTETDSYTDTSTDSGMDANTGGASGMTDPGSQYYNGQNYGPTQTDGMNANYSGQGNMNQDYQNMGNGGQAYTDSYNGNQGYADPYYNQGSYNGNQGYSMPNNSMTNNGNQGYNGGYYGGQGNSGQYYNPSSGYSSGYSSDYSSDYSSGYSSNEDQNQGNLTIRGNIPIDLRDVQRDSSGGIYIYQEEDELWLKLGNIRARLDTMIYEAPRK